MAVRLIDRVATAAEHRAIAESVGWTHAFDWNTIDASLSGSVAGVVAVDEDRVVAMGRLVGDGAKYFYVQDLAVIPEAQGSGLGSRVLDRLIELVALRAPSDAFVGLFATPEGSGLYRSRGFSDGDMTGMFRIVPPHARD